MCQWRTFHFHSAVLQSFPQWKLQTTVQTRRVTGHSFLVPNWRQARSGFFFQVFWQTWNIPSKIPATSSCHHESAVILWVASRNVSLDKQKMQNSPSAADLGKVQLQGVVQHHTESLEHVIVSSLSPRQDSAAQVMRPGLGETFEIKRLLKILSLFPPKSLLRTRGKNRIEFQHLATSIVLCVWI